MNGPEDKTEERPAVPESEFARAVRVMSGGVAWVARIDEYLNGGNWHKPDRERLLRWRQEAEQAYHANNMPLAIALMTSLHEACALVELAPSAARGVEFSRSQSRRRKDKPSSSDHDTDAARNDRIRSTHARLAGTADRTAQVAREFNLSPSQVRRIVQGGKGRA